MVPQASIIIMGISAALCLVLPVALFIYWRKKHTMHIVPVLLGIVAFFSIGLLLQQTVLMFLLRPDINGNSSLPVENPWLYVFIVTLSAGVFKQAGFFAAFHIIKKNHNAPGTALSLGIGYGGVEAFFMTGLAMVSYISVAQAVNAGNIEVFGDDPYILSLITALTQSNPALYIIHGMSAIITVVTSVALCVIVLGSITLQGKLWLLAAAVLLNMVLELPMTLLQVGFLINIWMVLALTLIPVALIIVTAFKVFALIPNTPAPGLMLEKPEYTLPIPK